MEIDKSLILKLEKLSRLTFNETERKEVMANLSNILTMIKKLDEIDSSQLESPAQLSTNVQPLREDIAKQSITREQALSNAPDQNGTFFKVPKVIEQ